MSSYSYRIDRDVCVVVIEGRVTFEVAAAAHKEYSLHPDFHIDIPRILDLRRCTDMMGLSDMMRTAEAAAKFNSGSKRRLIAAVCGDAMFEHLVKIYRDVVKQRRDAAIVEIEFFLDMEEAWAWIEAKRNG